MMRELCVRIPFSSLGFLFAAGGKQNNEQNQKNGQRHGRSNEQRLDLDGIGGHADGLGLVFHAVAANEQPVGIDAVGRAGHECTEILSRLDLERGNVVRLNDQNAVYLIGQHLVEHADHERIALDELVEVGEELRAGQAAMAGEHAVGAFSAGRERGPVEMADGDLEDRIVRPVVDRKRELDGRDLDVAHDAGTGDVQQAVILRALLVGQEIAVFAFQQRLVVVSGRRPQLVIPRLIEALHVGGVAGDGLRGVEGVPVVAYSRVQKQGHACKQDQDQKKRR